MLLACEQPKTSPLSFQIFSAIHSYAEVATEIIGGMSFVFRGINKKYLIDMAKTFRNVELVRYEPFIDMYENGLRKLYNRKEEKNG